MAGFWKDPLPLQDFQHWTHCANFTNIKMKWEKLEDIIFIIIKKWSNLALNRLVCGNFLALAVICGLGLLLFYLSLFMCNHATNSHMFSWLTTMLMSMLWPRTGKLQSFFIIMYLNVFANFFGLCTTQQFFVFFLLKLMSSHLVTGIQFSLIHLSQSIPG